MAVKPFNPNPGHKPNIIPAFQVPSNIDPELQVFLQALKETVENVAGNRGQPTERYVTLKELEDAGLIETAVKNRRAEISASAEQVAADVAASVVSATAFGDLIDVLLVARAGCDFVKYNSVTTNWENVQLTLDALSDFEVSGASFGDMLYFNAASKWVDTAGLLTWDGTQLNINSFLIGTGDAQMCLNLTTGIMVDGDFATDLLLNLDHQASLGGTIFGTALLPTTGLADVFGLFAGPGASPILQHSGAYADTDSILNIAVDVTVALSGGGGGAITIFVLSADTITIGDAAEFEQIEFTVTTAASDDVGMTFEFSTGVGTWAPFEPMDGTKGMSQTGIVSWREVDIPSWAIGTGSEFLIRITRNAAVVTTLPILDLVQISANTVYFWDSLGDLSVNNVLIDGLLTINDYVFPAADGTDGQVLTSDGAGTVTFETINHQKETYEGMSTRSLISSEFTEPVAFGITRNLRSAAAGTGSGVAGNTIDPADHPGIWTLQTGTTAAGRVFVTSIAGGTTIGTWRLGTGGIMRVGTWLRTGATLSTAPQRYTIRAGLSSMSLPNVLNEGVTFEYDDSQNGGRWQAICGDAPGVETTVDTGITVAINTWYKLEAEVNAAGTSVEFFIDDVSVATITTNIPTGGTDHLFYSVHIMKLIGTTNRDFHVDAMYAYQEISR